MSDMWPELTKKCPIRNCEQWFENDQDVEQHLQIGTHGIIERNDISVVLSMFRVLQSIVAISDSRSDHEKVQEVKAYIEVVISKLAKQEVS